MVMAVFTCMQNPAFVNDVCVTASQPSVFSFYNYKSLENAVAPNVALTPLPLGKVGPMSPSVPSTSHPSGGEPPGEGANGNSRPRKRRATGELPAPEASCPQSSAASKPPPQDDRDSEVEIEVESRDECKQKSHTCMEDAFCVIYQLEASSQNV